ncbi:bifunctional 2-methylcitrate synthase/citrate synthase [Tsukamurella tyrosinosolvens]|uniref:bifunctional 2-methylcitrate synthase/citrate synthase n=1 Tax=Tsukamurella tyrosinosolvens TaxID=57704 RepID=UPI001AF79C19|nr:bifunctional 2-methylcitrate synthase/citrate synthase [Tsukamurella tyrosinosolvens]QRY84506.1 bifunctional 2-methylcitrate synthase/citrate synthase [Tsukamurella tyrosinosolvens]
MTSPTIHRGLTGVVVDTTAVSKVVPETNSLTYRGYAVQDLAAACSFEQVAHLLWNGELPSREEGIRFEASERAARVADRSLLELVHRLPTTCHPMDVVRTTISYLGADDPEEWATTPEALQAKGLRMLAVLPTIVAADHRRRRGLAPIAPDTRLGYAENFLHMCFGEVPEPELVRAFEVSLILYAEHSFNASTFAARVVASTLSDMYSAVTAAVGALKGPLHGGANEAVMHDMEEIGDPANAEAWMRGKLDRREKVMGFGHRVYKNGDSRVPTMKRAFLDIAARTGGEKWVRIYDILERTMDDATGIKPNLDFPTGPAYHLLGFDTEVFTPIFVMARITGWTAHIIEQEATNALIRPLSAYVGVDQRAVTEQPAEA